MIPKPEMLSSPHPYWSSFKLLYDDLEESFRYVNPTKAHLKVYSLRFYEILIRACTEFESICKDIVIEHRLSKKESLNFNIYDYHLVNAYFEKKPSKLSVGYLFSEPLFVKPLDDWNNAPLLFWYSGYNTVKHNRVKEFEQANLENVLNSIAALFIIIERCGFCPPGKFSHFEATESYGKISGCDAWPVVIRKEYNQ